MVPKSSAVKIRTHPRIIFEKNRRLLSLGLHANLRILLLQPAFHERTILLVGANQRSLTGQAELRQQPSYGYHAELDREALRNQRTNLRLASTAQTKA